MRVISFFFVFFMNVKLQARNQSCYILGKNMEEYPASQSKETLRCNIKLIERQMKC